MKRDRLTPGLILLVIGIFLLLKNFGYLHIHWSNIIHLWPVFLVIGGINLIFANNRTVWASILKITVTVAGIALILLGNFGDNYTFFPEFHFGNSRNYDNSDIDDDADTAGNADVVKQSGSNFFHLPYAADAKVAKLEITGGGNRFELNDTTAQLFTADVKGDLSRYMLENHKEDSTSVINFKMKDKHHQNFNWHGGDDKNNTTIFKLNSSPLWDLTLKAGATELDFDLSKFKVRNFRISGGAASFKVKFGAPTNSDTNINVSSGVSDIKILVPKDAACSIVSSTGLSSNNFAGFNKTSDNHYQTDGFETAKKRIYITISGGMSDFSVDRY